MKIIKAKLSQIEDIPGNSLLTQSFETITIQAKDGSKVTIVEHPNGSLSVEQVPLKGNLSGGEGSGSTTTPGFRLP